MWLEMYLLLPAVRRSCVVGHAFIGTGRSSVVGHVLTGTGWSSVVEHVFTGTSQSCVVGPGTCIYN